MTVEQLMKEAGFFLTNTGGGCTAYEKTLGVQLDDKMEPSTWEKYLLITNLDDP